MNITILECHHIDFQKQRNPNLQLLRKPSLLEFRIFSPCVSMKMSDLKDDKKLIPRKISFCHHFGERKKNYENDRSVKKPATRERDIERESRRESECV